MITKTNRNIASVVKKTQPAKTTWSAQEEGELYDWMLTQRILMAIGELEDWKIAHIESNMPGNPWLREEPTDMEMGHALSSKDPDLNDALAQNWNHYGFSPKPMTFAEIRAMAERDIAAAR